MHFLSVPKITLPSSNNMEMFSLYKTNTTVSHLLITMYRAQETFTTMYAIFGKCCTIYDTFEGPQAVLASLINN